MALSLAWDCMCALSQRKGPVQDFLFSPLSHSLLPMSHTVVTRSWGEVAAGPLE